MIIVIRPSEAVAVDRPLDVLVLARSSEDCESRPDVLNPVGAVMIDIAKVRVVGGILVDASVWVGCLTVTIVICALRVFRRESHVEEKSEPRILDQNCGMYAVVQIYATHKRLLVPCTYHWPDDPAPNSSRQR